MISTPLVTISGTALTKTSSIFSTNVMTTSTILGTTSSTASNNAFITATMAARIAGPEVAMTTANATTPSPIFCATYGISATRATTSPTTTATPAAPTVARTDIAV